MQFKKQSEEMDVLTFLMWTMENFFPWPADCTLAMVIKDERAEAIMAKNVYERIRFQFLHSP